MDGWGVHLAADVKELATDQLQELLGTTGEHGHKPPRADIQKLKDIYDLWQRASLPPDPTATDPKIAEQLNAQWDARQEWTERFHLNDVQEQLLENYLTLIREKGFAPEKAFDQISYAITHGTYGITDWDEAKRYLGQILKKYEESNAPKLYQTIEYALNDAYRGNNESFKLWPWMVKQIKDSFKNKLHFDGRYSDINPDTDFRPAPAWDYYKHMVDVVTEVGPVLNQLRAENQIPQNFDVSKMSFKELEDWFMEWKKANRDSLAKGEVVYKFHDDWTIEKLTTDEQLQFEGDEMGHCVGGYGHAVSNGRSIIYSLRDPKGTPHATIEMRPIWSGRDGEGNDDYMHPEDIAHAPQQDLWQDAPIFEVVQIMGNSNNMPKAEYQRKVKEWLDALRAKGNLQFEWSDDAHRPYDEDGEEYDNVRTAEKLDRWWDESYRPHQTAWQGASEDAYGMTNPELKFPVGDWDDLFQSIIYELTDSYDRSKWGGGDPRTLAEAVYHAWVLENHAKENTPEKQKQATDALDKEIESVQQHLWEQRDDYIESARYGYGGDHYASETFEKFEQVMRNNGQWQAFDERVEELLGEDGDEGMNDRDERYRSVAEELASEEFEDEWFEAEALVNDGIAEGIFSDADKFMQTLYLLVNKHPMPHISELPDPNQRGGGLPLDHELEEMPWLDPKFNKPAENPETETEGPSIPGALSSWKQSAPVITIHPISEQHNIWFDEDGNQRARYRPGWAKNPETNLMEQTGELQDTFLDKQGRQGQGWVAYHGDVPVGSLTYVDDRNGWQMLGTTYVHPNYRNQGIFNRLAEPLRSSGKPTDAYVWNNPWLKNKVRDWQRG